MGARLLAARSLHAALAFAWLALCLLPCGEAKTVRTHTCVELGQALADETADHIIMAHVEGGWNCSAAELPPHTANLRRPLVLEGEGPGLLYYDTNRVNKILTIGEGGNLTQRNIWADDCLQSAMPGFCFSVNTHRGAFTHAENMEMSDSSCVRVRHSQAINWVLTAIRYAKLFNVKVESTPIDSRRLRIDTGWMPGLPVGSYFRFTNVTFSCTGNLTHPLPPDFVDEPDTLLQEHPHLLIAIGVAVLIMAGSLCWCARTSGRNSRPEYEVALSQGYKLEEPLGSGHYGRVYRARDMASGQLVAVKVIDMLPSQRRQVATALRECDLMSQMNHECVVKLHKFYSAQVRRHRHQVLDKGSGSLSLDGSSSSSWFNRLLPGAARQRGRGQRGAAGSGGGSGSSGASVWGSDSGASTELGSSRMGSGSSGGLNGTMGGAGSSLRDGGVSGLEDVPETEAVVHGTKGVLLVQVQLVMQFCDLGSLEKAIQRRDFHQPETGQPLVRHIVLTALEIARGLEYLHHPDRRMVHRDLSAANVLLATAPGDERGFRAQLSDFGLSTSLSHDATHRTSEVKGTISYMSPEVFTHYDVSPALDIYSFGIVGCMMCSGMDPYEGQTPAMVIFAKVRSPEGSGGERIPPIDGIPAQLQQLLWDCTAHDKRDRPTAGEIVGRLEDLLLSL